MLTLLCLSRQSRDWLIVSAAMVSLAVMTRAVGLALLPSVLIAARRESWPTKAMLLIAMLGPWMAWTLMRSDISQLSGHASYTMLIKDILEPNSFQSVLDTVSANLTALVRAWTSYWLPSSPLTAWLSLPASLLASIGLIHGSAASSLKLCMQ